MEVLVLALCSAVFYEPNSRHNTASFINLITLLLQVDGMSCADYIKYDLTKNKFLMKLKLGVYYMLVWSTGDITHSEIELFCKDCRLENNSSNLMHSSALFFTSSSIKAPESCKIGSRI